MSLLRIVNPATGNALAELPADSPARIAELHAAARAAQPAWAATPLAERVDVLRRFHAAVETELDSLAATLSAEVGKPVRQSRNELRGFLGRIEYFLTEVGSVVARECVHDDAGVREEIEHEPLGVVASVSAWNYPYFVGGNVFVPALLTGNAVLYKPSEHATLSGRHIARLLHGAGVPPAVFGLVVGAGAAGAALVERPVDGVFFTGSAGTGLGIARSLAGRPIALQLELGGKDPTYVCDDADVAAAAESLADGAMYNAGQSCCSVERIYVHARVHDAFVDALVAAVRRLEVGDPLLESTDVGPLARAAQLDVLEAQVADALALGATLQVGGRRIERPGHWFEPTVLTDVDHRMQVMRDESFGPIVGVQRVADDAEALALMNDTRYGLTAGVYSADEARARALLARANAGSVYWNCCDRVSPRLPWSGRRDSGIGVTLSRAGIAAFTRPRAWHLRHG